MVYSTLFFECENQHCKIVFNMLKKNFPKSNPFSKIFNKNIIKFSYTSTRNMKSIISSHNKQILTPKNKQVGSNCRIKNSCAHDKKCLTSQLIYQGDVTNNLDDEYKYYLADLQRNKRMQCEQETLRYIFDMR